VKEIGAHLNSYIAKIKIKIKIKLITKRATNLVFVVYD
jgi:hypothetical protein